MTFTHLNVKSGFSLMESTVKIPELVDEAKRLGFQSLALTDENTMSGSVSFYRACKQKGIKPLIGLKTRIEDQDLHYPVLLFAENNEGYKNLLQLSSAIQLEGRPVSLDLLEQKRSGLIVVLLTSQSPWAQTIAGRMFDHIKDSLNRWRHMVGEDNFYLAIQDLDLHEERQLHQPLQEWSKREGVPVVAIGDVRYLKKEDAAAYESLKAIEANTRFSGETAGARFYLKKPEEMENYFQEWWPGVLRATEEIAERVNLALSFDQQLLPTYPTPEGVRADRYLEELCLKALAKKYPATYKAAEERLHKELSVITSMNFSDYFLIVWDFLAYAKKQGIHAGPGRGSAAGSLVAYLLNITQVDPLEYDLLFERFLNPERITMPDIDIDFPDHRRDEVIAYVAEKYGADHVAQICTFGTFAVRSVLRELFKVLAVDESDAAFILKQIPKTAPSTITEIVRDSEELSDYIRNSPKLQRLFQIATKLEGLPRHVSTHAAGVVISERPLQEYTALMDGHNGIPLTQLAMGDLEKVGLLKIDFLGLRNLTFIEKMEGKIKRFRDSSFSVERIPLDDEKTFHLLEQGRTNGVFQLESQGMKGVLRRLRPSHFEDVVAVNALYRPGPMDYIPDFISRKQGNQAMELPHPDLKGILDKTYGVLVYQEQIMQVAQLVAGYSLGEADLLRRAISKKQSGILEDEREKFLKGCRNRGYTEAVARQVFEWIVKFANYGFNRSHAVAYSLISYRLAYMKAHYPSYFLAELINSYVGDRDKLTLYLREAKESGLKVLPPSINRSHIVAKDEQGAIRIGLLSVKGVGYQAAQAVVEERGNGRFRSLNDFCLRVRTKIVTRGVIESLILAGAFDETHENRAALLASIDQALEQGELFKEFQDQPGFFGNEFEMELIEVDPFPPLKLLAMEKEVLGTYMSEHPLEHHRQLLQERGINSLNKVVNIKGTVKTAGVVETIREIRTKRGESMAFATLGDETTELEAVIFPDSYRNIKRWLQEQMLVTVTGKVEERNGRKQLIINEASVFNVEEKPTASEQRLFIKVTKETEPIAMEKLKKVSGYFPGNIPVFIFKSQERKTYRLGELYNLSASPECMEILTGYFGDDSVALKEYSKDTKN
ncbi:UNVERIFIED_CONTAM: DNA polymerase III subunit alpha [Halobacillus marinus]